MKLLNIFSNKSDVLNVVCIALLPFLGVACMRVQKYTPKKLSTLSQEFCDLFTANGVTIKAKRLKKDDVKELFGKRGLWLVRKKRNAFVPLHIVIHNQSNKVLVIGPDMVVGLKVLPNNVIINRLCTEVFFIGLFTSLSGIFGVSYFVSAGCALSVGSAFFFFGGLLALS